MKKAPPVSLDARTSQGRVLTAKGYDAIGLKTATGNQQSLL